MFTFRIFFCCLWFRAVCEAYSLQGVCTVRPYIRVRGTLEWSEKKKLVAALYWNPATEKLFGYEFGPIAPLYGTLIHAHVSSDEFIKKTKTRRNQQRNENASISLFGREFWYRTVRNFIIICSPFSSIHACLTYQIKNKNHWRPFLLVVLIKMWIWCSKRFQTWWIASYTAHKLNY